MISHILDFFRLIESLLDKFPNYGEKKKADYYELKKKYLTELAREDRDDNLVCIYARELQSFISSLRQENL